MDPPHPLALESPRWALLKAHFGNAGGDGDLPAVPSLIARWHDAVGSYDEEYAYEPLRESFLHQGTILDVAYAVVPHIVARAAAVDPDRRVEVLDDVATVEAVRHTPRSQVEALVRELERTVGPGLQALLIQNTRDRHPLLPEDLAAPYLAAVTEAKRLAGADWGTHRSEAAGAHHTRRHVRHLRSVGWTEEDIQFGVQALLRESAEGALIDEGVQRAREGLRNVDDAPDGWFLRTGLHAETDADSLAVRALFAVAWLAPPRL